MRNDMDGKVDAHSNHYTCNQYRGDIQRNTGYSHHTKQDDDSSNDGNGCINSAFNRTQYQSDNEDHKNNRDRDAGKLAVQRGFYPS